MVNLLLITVAITIVVMGSKSCGFFSATKLAEFPKMWRNAINPKKPIGSPSRYMQGKQHQCDGDAQRLPEERQNRRGRHEGVQSNVAIRYATSVALAVDKPKQGVTLRALSAKIPPSCDLPSQCQPMLLKKYATRLQGWYLNEFVNEPEQTMSLILEYDLTWNDPRLTWNSSEFHDINGFFVNRDAVWRPDVVPYDMLSISDTRDVDIQHVYVKSNGDMLYYASRVVTVLCPLKIQRFPFDHQVCEVGFSSYTFWIAELRLVSAVKPYINATTAGTGEWTVVEIVTGSPELLVEETSETYGTVYYIIRVKRSSTFYIVMIVLPSFILTFLCVLGLFWTKFDKTDYLEKNHFEDFKDRQEELVSKLLSDYRKDLPPIYARARGNLSLANPMTVKISLRYIKLLAINEPEQTIAVILEYDLVKSNGDVHHYASRVVTVVCPLNGTGEWNVVNITTEDATILREDGLPSFELLALGFAAILAMCTVLEIVEQSVPKTKQLPALCKSFLSMNKQQKKQIFINGQKCGTLMVNKT
ncbi:Neurotransmitter-gated ion-channel ligand binding domain protein [Ostertagia ostertagi]